MAVNDTELARLYVEHHAQVRTLYEQQLIHHRFHSLVIASGEVGRVFFDDQNYTFRVNPHFKYWLALTQCPKSFIVVVPGSRPLLVLFSPEDFWEKSGWQILDEWVQHFDLILGRTQLEVTNAVKERAVGAVALIGEPGAFACLGTIDHAEMNPSRLLDHLHFRRAWKSGYEVACMREANRIAALGHCAASTAFAAGASEFQIHQSYLLAAGQLETQLPYVSIIGLNENASCLHYRQKSLALGQATDPRSLIIDAGAQFRGYASDVTRTYASHPSEFRDLIDALDAGQQALIQRIKPGMHYEALNVDAHLLVAQLLFDFDIVRLPPEAMVECGITGIFFPHGLGHLIGLQVHDAGGHMASATGLIKNAPEKYPFLRLTRALDAGFAVTIEPGFYFIESLLATLRASSDSQFVNWEKVGELKKYGGIRIEDNIIIHSDRIENMTRDAWKSVRKN